MDGETFDILVKRLTQTRLTRWEALRGVLASVVVGLTGASIAADTVAKRKRKHKGSAKQQGQGHHKHHKHHRHHHKHHGGGGGGGGGTPTTPPPSPPLSPPGPLPPPSPPTTTTTSGPPSLPSPPPSPPPLGELPPCTPEGRACQQSSECCGGNCFGQVCAPKPSTCPLNGAPQTCSATATGCCAGAGCCEPPANQCNITGGQAGLCCAPNCANRECGDDGCGNTGTCGSCLPGQTCSATGRCQGTPTCSPATCANGCCDASGTCRPGDTNQVCGTGGGACQNCSSQGQVCGGSGTPGVCGCASDAATCAGKCGLVTNNCGRQVDCIPLCAGCCDENAVCQPGDQQFACGTGGVECGICIFASEGRCVNGHCQCDATFCAQVGFPNGCCANEGPGTPGFCEPGTSNEFCGGGGATCVTCPLGTSCNSQRQCVCTPTSCPSGQQCCGGQCKALLGGACSATTDCCAGQECCRGTCRLPTGASGCTANEHCCSPAVQVDLCCGGTCCFACEVCNPASNTCVGALSNGCDCDGQFCPRDQVCCFGECSDGCG